MSPSASERPPSPDAPAPEPARLLEAARIAASAAADHIRSIDRTRIDREEKTSAHDIVTEHDRACEEIIVENLQRLVPGCRIVGEEGGEREGDGPSDVTFYVDPIDGTSNFAAGLPLFCVSIGAAVGDDVVAGVVDAPVLGQVFTADDRGAFLNGQPLRPRSTRPARDALVLTGFPTVRDLEEDRAGALAAGVEMSRAVSAVRCLGSAALELCYVGAGWADATMLSRINPWDVAAGFLVVRRAGGSLRTWPGGSGVGSGSTREHEQPAYVACTGPERIDVLDTLQQRIQDRRGGAVTPADRDG